MVARADTRIGALQAIDTNNLQTLILGIGINRTRDRAAFPGDFYDIALLQTQLSHGLA